MTAVLAGCAAGLVALLISELTLAWWRNRPDMQPMRVVFTGMLARAAWMLTALVGGFALDLLGEPGFLASLFVVYLVSQVVEGFRFQRFARQRLTKTA